LTGKQKEYAAKIIAEGYLAKNDSGEVVCAIPVFTKEQYELFVALVQNNFTALLSLYSKQVKKY